MIIKPGYQIACTFVSRKFVANAWESLSDVKNLIQNPRK